MVKQYSIYWIKLDPTEGAEMNKTRPCMIISPDVMNRNLATVLVAPITSSDKGYPTRVEILIEDRKAFIVLDQIRCLDKKRIGNIITHYTGPQIYELKSIIKQMLVD